MDSVEWYLHGAGYHVVALGRCVCIRLPMHSVGHCMRTRCGWDVARFGMDGGACGCFVRRCTNMARLGGAKRRRRVARYDWLMLGMPHQVMRSWRSWVGTVGNK